MTKTILDLKKDFEVYTIDEFKKSNDRKFDVIHLGDTLEHTGDPVNLINYLLKNLVKKVYYLLKDLLKEI